MNSSERKLEVLVATAVHRGEDTMSREKVGWEGEEFFADDIGKVLQPNDNHYRVSYPEGSPPRPAAELGLVVRPDLKEQFLLPPRK